MTQAGRAGMRRAAAGLALALVAAGCGGSAARPAGTRAPAPVPLSLMTSVSTAGTTWATIPMGAPSGPNQFWQLFTLTGPAGHWVLRTPAGVATNGALVLAGPGWQTLTAGIRPSLDLGFSPVTATRDGGRTWSSLPPSQGSRTSRTRSPRPPAASSSPSARTRPSRLPRRSRPAGPG